MRSVVVLGRLCFRQAFTTGPTAHLRTQNHSFLRQLRYTRRLQAWPRVGKRTPFLGTVLLATALTPGAFLEIAEQNGDGIETGEMAMLEASRDELRCRASGNITGILRFKQILYVSIYAYVYEPIATGFRILHLAALFLPVIVAVPSLWIGRRYPKYDNERAGALWWYDFLVWSMEQAGPAFIKVGFLTLFFSPNFGRRNFAKV
jgi:aarF domain-containing kinase